jgi:hypothetical protein
MIMYDESAPTSTGNPTESATEPWPRTSKIPVWNWRDAIRKVDVEPGTKLVCHEISCHLSDAGKAWQIPVKEIIANTGLSNTSVAKHFQLAEEAGLLKIERGNRGRYQVMQRRPLESSKAMSRRSGDDGQCGQRWKMDQRSIVDLLGKTAFFGLLSEADRSAIAGRMRRVEFEPDQMIFSRGDPGPEIYLVLEGHIRLSVLCKRSSHPTWTGSQARPAA